MTPGGGVGRAPGWWAAARRAAAAARAEEEARRHPSGAAGEAEWDAVVGNMEAMIERLERRRPGQ